MSSGFESVRILAVVIARGGSKGIPGKNLALLGGKPLVSHIITSAVAVADKAPLDVVISTDSEDIREVAVEAGAWAPFIRPAELAGDEVESLPVVQHAVREVETRRKVSYDIIAYLQPTTPLCRSEDIETCIRSVAENISVSSAVAVTEVETHPFKMKRLLEDGRLINYIDQGFEEMRPRQFLPKVYRRAGSVYVSRREVVMEQDTLVGEPCMGIPVPPETAVDIDSPVDLELVRLLYERNAQLS